MTTTATPSTAAPRTGRRVGRLLVDQLVHSLLDLWRSRIVFVFTFIFPLTWLVVLGFIIGNATVDDGSGVRMMQFVTPTAAVMGVLYGTFPTVASSLADAREKGVLKRFRGTPLPTWTFLAGRIGASAVFALASLLTMLVVGVVVYDVQILGRTLLATLVTALVAIVCFTTIGLAVATLARTAVLAQSASIGVSVALGFVSGVLGVGDLPGWADRFASLFPLKHFNDAIQEQFDPFESVATSRDRGALKRLRGTPLSPALFLLGRMVSALAVAVATGALVLLVGVLAFDLRISSSGLPLALAVLLLGTVSMTACGFALASVVPSSRAVSAVGLGVLLPLAFFSDVFAFSETPAWMGTVGSVFPLKHLANSVTDALAASGPGVSWLGLLVMTVWLVALGLVSRAFRWSART